MEIGVSAVLVFREVELLGRVVGFAVAGGNDGSSCIDVEIDIALHADGTTEIISCWQQDSAATSLTGFLYGSVDGRRIEVLAISLGTEITNIIRLCYGRDEE